MKTRNLGIILDQGVDFSLVIGISDENGPVDITGYIFKSQMRPSTLLSSPVALPTVEFSFQILNQSTNKGKVRWYAPAASFSSLVASVSSALQNCRQTTPFVFDVKMKDTAGTPSRPIQGIMYLSPQATQETI